MSINRRLFLLLSSSASLGIVFQHKRLAQAATTCTVVNVKEQGAIGDGVTDDTAAIQKAIDLGCSVYFPAGSYKVNGLNLRSNCTYYGDGDKSIIKLFQKVYSKSQIGAYQSNAAFNLNELQNVTVRNLKFICPTSKKKNIPAIEYANIAINVNSSNNCQIESVVIEEFSGIAILCAGSSNEKRCSNVVIDDAKIGKWYDTYEGSFPQIWFFKYVYNSVVQNSSLEGGTFGIGLYDAYSGIKINGRGADLPGAGVYNCELINNTIKNQTRYGILLYCTRSVAFPKESVQYLVQGNTISNILGSSHVKDKGFGAGIYAVGVTDLMILDNTVSNCNQLTNIASLAPGCIGVVGCYGNVLIDGNTCFDGKWSNLYISNINVDRVGQLTVTNNTLTNSIKENLFCSNVNGAFFYGNKISSDKTAKSSPVSFRSVKNVVFKDNTILFDSPLNQDALFVFQSSKLEISNNNITTLNPVSINRLQEVSDSVISGNVYNSANSASQEPIRVVKGRNNKFIQNTINKPSGGKKIMNYDK